LIQKLRKKQLKLLKKLGLKGQQKNFKIAPILFINSKVRAAQNLGQKM
jgi:hypothetical protein